MRWVMQNQDECFPSWLSEHLPSKCAICGSELMNGYNTNMECTRRRCSNESCPGILSARIAKLCDILGVVGIKEGKAMRMVNENNLKSHWEAIPLLFSEKPDLPMGTYLRCCFIYGIDATLEDIGSKYDTVDEMFEKYTGRYIDLLYQNRDAIYAGLEFVNILKNSTGYVYNPVIVGEVNITGNVNDYADREGFIGSINEFFKGLVRIKYTKSKRKTGLLACIAEDQAITTGKIASALEGGIPIMTPDEFRNYLVNRVMETEDGKTFIENLLREAG